MSKPARARSLSWLKFDLESRTLRCDRCRITTPAPTEGGLLVVSLPELSSAMVAFTAQHDRCGEPQAALAITGRR